MRRAALIGMVGLLAAVDVSAIRLNVTTEDIERALAIGRNRAVERAPFHQPYIVKLTDATVTEVEVITEFRRYVLATEDHIRRGIHSFAHSVRSAQEVVAPWQRRVSIIARLRFHPLNVYVNVPPVDMTLDGASGELRPIGILRDPVLSLPSGVPGQGQPILGALIEAVFEAELIGQYRRTVIVRLEEKELTRTTFDFGSLE